MSVHVLIRAFLTTISYFDFAQALIWINIQSWQNVLAQKEDGKRMQDSVDTSSISTDELKQI